MSTVQLTVEIIPETCCKCSVPFGIEKGFRNSRLEDHQPFYCPNGHAQVYTGPTAAQKLEKELAATKARLDQVAADANWQRAEVERQKRAVAAAKGQVTKIKRRAAGGVCACCNRYFPNLHRHMTTQHPDEQKAEGVRGFEEVKEK